FKDQEAVHKVADYMLRENKITGAIHAAFSWNQAGNQTAQFPDFLGVDDNKLYHEHVQAYKDSFPKVQGLKQDLEREEKRLMTEKDSFFNPILKDFDVQVGSYRAGTLPLGKYVRVLVSKMVSEMVSDTVSGTGRQIPLLLKALSMEE